VLFCSVHQFIYYTVRWYLPWKAAIISLWFKFNTTLLWYFTQSSVDLTFIIMYATIHYSKYMCILSEVKYHSHQLLHNSTSCEIVFSWTHAYIPLTTSRLNIVLSLYIPPFRFTFRLKKSLYYGKLKHAWARREQKPRRDGIRNVEIVIPTLSAWIRIQRCQENQTHVLTSSISLDYYQGKCGL
jgi:hypothetical protein